MGRVVLDHLSKTFRDPQGREVAAVRDVSLTVEPGELLVLVGPSGSGKTTLLRLIAGLETATRGAIVIDGRTVNDVPPADRDVAMVFQHHALFPHLTVFENLALGLRLRKTARPEIESRVRDTAELLGLAALLQRRPAQLSGGERQRVALGRAWIRRPKVFLLDEPLASLDAPLRTQLRAEIRALQRRLGATMIHVTHDQAEALALGDRVAVVNGGEVQQIAEPCALYRHPANRFVAGFIGVPPMNFVRATPVPGERVLELRWPTAETNALDGHPPSTGRTRLPLPETAQLEPPPANANLEAGRATLPRSLGTPQSDPASSDSRPAAVALLRDHPEAGADREWVIGLRPEHIRLAPVETAPPPASEPTGVIELIEPLGADAVFQVRLGPLRWMARGPGTESIAVGQRVALICDWTQAHGFEAATGRTVF